MKNPNNFVIFVVFFIGFSFFSSFVFADIQAVEGFSGIVSAANQGKYNNYRNQKVMSYWEYAGWYAYKGYNQKVEWKTATVPSNYNTGRVTFIWTGSNGIQGGEHDLYLNGKKILTFTSNVKVDTILSSGNYELFFDYKNNNSDNAGVYYLTAPAVDLVSGQQTIRVEGTKDGGSLDWFMVHNFTDTINYENNTGGLQKDRIGKSNTNQDIALQRLSLLPKNPTYGDFYSMGIYTDQNPRYFAVYVPSGVTTVNILTTGIEDDGLDLLDLYVGKNYFPTPYKFDKKSNNSETYEYIYLSNPSEGWYIVLANHKDDGIYNFYINIKVNGVQNEVIPYVFMDNSTVQMHDYIQVPVDKIFMIETIAENNYENFLDLYAKYDDFADRNNHDFLSESSTGNEKIAIDNPNLFSYYYIDVYHSTVFNDGLGWYKLLTYYLECVDDYDCAQNEGCLNNQCIPLIQDGCSETNKADTFGEMQFRYIEWRNRYYFLENEFRQINNINYKTELYNNFVLLKQAGNKLKSTIQDTKDGYFKDCSATSYYTTIDIMINDITLLVSSIDTIMTTLDHEIDTHPVPNDIDVLTYDEVTLEVAEDCQEYYNDWKSESENDKYLPFIPTLVQFFLEIGQKANGYFGFRANCLVSQIKYFGIRNKIYNSAVAKTYKKGEEIKASVFLHNTNTKAEARTLKLTIQNFNDHSATYSFTKDISLIPLISQFEVVDFNVSYYAPEGQYTSKIEICDTKLCNIVYNSSSGNLFEIKGSTYQPVEGFSSIVASSNQGIYNNYRSQQVMSYWEYAAISGNYIEWRTAIVPSTYTTGKATFIWTGSNGIRNGLHDLYLNGNKIMTFNSGQNADKIWTNGNYELFFDYKNNYADNAGVYYLTVPVSAITPNAKSLIKIKAAKSGGGLDWIMAHNFTDTIKYETNTGGLRTYRIGRSV